MSERSINIRIPVLSILGVLLVVLKLTGHISISWLWVLAPFWVPLVVVVGVLGMVLLAGIVAAVLEK